MGNLARGGGNDGNACIFTTSSDTRIEGNQVRFCQVGIDVGGLENVVVKNNAMDCGTNYSVAAGNDFGTVVASPVGAGAWDNISD